jgi:hypothetical protein
MVICIIVSGVAICARCEGGDQGPARAEANKQAGRPTVTYPNCVKIFNGVNFERWEADPSTWSVTNGAMRGMGGTSRLAYTKADYGSFHLIFTARMNPVNRDHLGVLFWGDRPKDPTKPKIDNAGWLQFMPPFAGMWDYHPPQHHNLPHETIAKGSSDSTKWCTTEILCNRRPWSMATHLGAASHCRRIQHHWSDAIRFTK